MNDETIKCPYCAELILKDAKKCRYCGEFLNVDIEEKKAKRSKRKLSGFSFLMYTVATIIILGIVIFLIIAVLTSS